jgi:hypothetical protein
VPANRRTNGLWILDVARRVFVERAPKDLERLRDDCVAVQRERIRRRRPCRVDLRRIQRHALVASLRDVVVREVQGVGDRRLFDDLIIAGVANVPVDGEGVRGRPLEREAGLEERSVEVMRPLPRCVAMQLAGPQDELARERVVGELHGGNDPRERFPVANRDTRRVPGRARPDEIEVRIVDRAADGVEVREQQIAVDEAIDCLDPC